MSEQTYTEEALKRMTDAKLVLMAKDLGMDTSAFTPPGDDFKDKHKDAVLGFILSKQAPRAAPAKGGGIKPGCKVRLVIPTQSDGAGDKPVKVSVNGRMTLIPRDVEVIVPYEVFHVLENAEEGASTWTAKSGLKVSKRKRFPYTVLGTE